MFLLPLKAQVKANKKINVAMSCIEGKRRYLYIYIYTMALNNYYIQVRWYLLLLYLIKNKTL